MGSELYQLSPVARAVFDQADELLGFSLSDLCFNGPERKLTDTVNQQPALFVTSIATLRAMETNGWAKSPTYVAGHSLGEISALVAAGSICFADGLQLVRWRGELMKAASEREPGGMAAILALDVAIVRDICRQAMQTTGQPVQVANDNCPGQVVISGDSEALATAVALTKEAGARKVVELPITIASHSELMASATPEFVAIVEATDIKVPQIPVIGNVSAKPLATPDDIRIELKAQLTAPVAWADSMRYLIAHGVDTVVEVGSGDVLQGLMKRIDRKVERLSFRIENVK